MSDGKNRTKKEYVKRINIVLDFIEINLEADLSLDLLAQKAHYSPYHFHRIFLTVIGENINQYIIRKRLERIASILLTDPKRQIKKLAYAYGFNSQSSFSRTFKKYYGITPTKFKLEGKSELSKIGIQPYTTEKYICSIDQISKWIKMNAKIVVTVLQEIKLAGITHIGEFEKIGSLYSALMEWGQKNKVVQTSNFKTVTIYHDNPNITQFSKVRCSACITVDKEIKDEGEIRPLKIHNGIYAVGHFEIEGKEISNAWKSMNIWVIENGYQFRDGDYFEIYHNDHKTHPEQKFIIDICIPLEREKSMKFDKLRQIDLSNSNNKGCKTQVEYHQLVSYMKELRAFFKKEYETYFKLGKLNHGSSDFTYFSLTPEELKKLKLKFVIILDHRKQSFEICLSGQNKSIRKKYWKMFKDSDWDKYHIAESIDNNLLIIDHTLVRNPDFDNSKTLVDQDKSCPKNNP